MRPTTGVHVCGLEGDAARAPAAGDDEDELRILRDLEYCFVASQAHTHLIKSTTTAPHRPPIPSDGTT